MSSLIGTKFDNGYNFDRHPVQNLREYLPYTAATTSTHYVGEYLQGADIEAAESWAKALGYKTITREDLPVIEGIERRSRSFFDPTTTLKVVVYVNEKRQELLITFGAKDSFRSESRSESEASVLNGIQNEQITQNLLGHVSPVYPKAEMVVTALLKHENFLPYKKMISAQSFGGSIAQFVGLRLALPAYIFNSLPIGAGLQREIGAKKLKNANDLIKHLSVDTDFLSDGNSVGRGFDRALCWIGIATPGTFGFRETIPTSYPKDFFKTHAFVMGSVAISLGYKDPKSGEDLRQQLDAGLPLDEDIATEIAIAKSVNKDEDDEKGPTIHLSLEEEASFEIAVVESLKETNKNQIELD